MSSGMPLAPGLHEQRASTVATYPAATADTAKPTVCRGCGTPITPPQYGRRIWCSDRCRKQTSYSTPCVDCGQPTNGSEGHAITRERCGTCRYKHQHDSRHWTPETVIAALQEWARELGRTPTAKMALKAGAKVSCWVVQREFGSWSAAIRAAGLTPNPGGRPRKR